MLFGSIISSPRDVLLPPQMLELANIYLDNARKTTDACIALVLCHDTEVALSAAARGSKRLKVPVVREGIAAAYLQLGWLLKNRRLHEEAEAFYKKAEKLGERVQEHQPDRFEGHHQGDDLEEHAQESLRVDVLQEDHQDQVQGHLPLTKHGLGHSSHGRVSQTPDLDTALVPVNPMPTPNDPISQTPGVGQKQGRDKADTPSRAIFAKNIRPLGMEVKLPKADERLSTTPQLAACLSLLKHSQLLGDMLDPPTRKWLEAIEKDSDEQDRLKILVTNVIRAFQREEIKDDKAVAEVVCLAPVLEKSDFQYLLRELCKGVDQSVLLDLHQLDGIAQLIHCAEPGYLDADDLVKILELVSTRLRNTHNQSSNHMYQLTMAVSRVLDAMADTNVKGLDRVKLHEPLSSYLGEIKDISDPYLMYQAAYAYQALLYVPDDETLWQATLRRTGKVIQGVAGLVSAVKGLDLNGFMDGLKDIQQGVSGADGVFKLARSTIDGVKSLSDSGKDFVDCMKEGLVVKRKLTWYPALRGAESLLRSGQLAQFKRLVYEAPCQLDPAFQWGVCQMLGEVAADSMWDTKTRQSAIMFLGEIYSDRTVLECQANIKGWILVILMKLASSSGDDMQAAANSQIRDLESKSDSKEQAYIQGCRQKDHTMYPLRSTFSMQASSSLIDRAQNRPDVEGHLRQLRRQHLTEQGNAVYIPPQAKAGLQASDEARFQLLDKVKEFLNSEQRVFLLLGDPGAGKSTFSKALDRELWEAYKKDGDIPLHINLPAIDKPEHEMIAKQLRKMELTEQQIRELKTHRKFILICDGYDESQQTHNLYTTNRLNERGEWTAKMIISCRTEYLGSDYRDRFQPGDRNQQSISTQFQEAVITPFSKSQIDRYIDEYVSIHQPLWEARDYKKALYLIPGLKQLVKNPFLMTLSLEVMPRMMDPGEHLSAAHITKVGLYDHFIEHWFERGKKRLGEKKLTPQLKAAFEGLIDEGFTRTGIDFLKKLAVAVYKEQDGQPIIEYSRYKDEHSWKSEFFSRDDEKQLLREACPLTRNANQYRFIHRSLLEYGLAIAVFDPQDLRRRGTFMPSMERRGSASSVSSFEIHGDTEREIHAIKREPDLSSPLAWRSFVNEHSLVKFLEERVQQEPVFRQQLLDYIESSKVHKKWRTAAANAITILVRAGFQFMAFDLQGIRIPGADLSYGMFDAANLQGADLRKVNLSNASLLESDLSKAQMKDVQFGELPFLKFDQHVYSCAYSPDGTSFAVTLSDGNIHMYGTLNWDRTWISSGQGQRVSSIVFSPNGDRIFSVSWDSTMRIWDVITGDCLYIFIGHARVLCSVAYSPQGNVVALIEFNGITVRLRDLDTGYCRYITVSSRIYGMMYSPKGDTIALGCNDCRVRLWDVGSGEFQRILIGHTTGVGTITYSAEGDLLMSQDVNNVVRVWEVKTGACRQIIQGDRCAVLSPKGNQIAFNHSFASKSRNEVALWDVETGTRVRRLSDFKGSIYSVAYSPHGDQIVTCGADKEVRLWDVETGECRQTMSGHTGAVTKVLFSPKGGYIASISGDKTVRLWNVGSGYSQKISNHHSGAVLDLKHSPKRNQVASCSQDKTIRLWDAELGICNRTLTGHRGEVKAISYSPQEDRLVSCSRDNTVRLWDVESGACLHILSGHIYTVFDVAFSPQGDQIASASQDEVRLWNAETGKCQHVLTGHSRGISAVIYSPQGNQIASAGDDGTVRFWDVETGDCQHTLTDHSGSIRKVVYSSNGNQIASTNQHGTVRLWDVKMGVCSHTLRDYQIYVTCVVYSPRGDQVASAGSAGILDNTVRLWDTDTGECHHTLAGLKERIDAIAYSPGGNLIASWSDKGEGRLWDVVTGDCVWNIESVGMQWSTGLSSNPFVWMSSDVDSFIAGDRDGLLRRWVVIKDGDQYRVRMRWKPIKGELALKSACVQEVQGLSDLNKRLLKQRGATGEPSVRLRETSKKVMTMTSVVSKLKSSSSNTEAPDSPSTVAAIDFTEHSEQRSEQAMGTETLEN